MISPDNESDLRWYFSEARGACGVKSPLGAQLDIMRTGTMRGKHERVVVADINERTLMAAERANRIGKRLRKLAPNHVPILRLQYDADEAANGCQVGASRLLDGVRVALIVSTPIALRLHNAIARTSSRKHPEQSPPTRVMWLAWLCRRAKDKKAEREAETLSVLLTSAQGLLNAAHAAYEAT